MDLAALIEKRAAMMVARTNGVRTVRHGEKEVTYRSETELASAIAALDREIAAAQGQLAHTFLPTFSKGF